MFRRELEIRAIKQLAVGLSVSVQYARRIVARGCPLQLAAALRWRIEHRQKGELGGHRK